MPTLKPNSTQPRRLSQIKVSEISLCAVPANEHAVALLRKSADLDRRASVLEKQHLTRVGQERLLKAAHEVGERLQAQAENRQYVAPLPATAVSKGASGGERLVARAASIAKAHYDAQQAQQAAQGGYVAPVTKVGLSPGERLILAAQERAAAMRKVG